MKRENLKIHQNPPLQKLWHGSTRKNHDTDRKPGHRGKFRIKVHLTPLDRGKAAVKIVPFFPVPKSALGFDNWQLSIGTLGGLRGGVGLTVNVRTGPRF